MGIEAVCVTIAMYCLIQFYVQLRHDLKQHSPFLKILSIKLVIFLSFWQTVCPRLTFPFRLLSSLTQGQIIISFLTSSRAIKPTKQFQMPDVKIGIPSMLLCIEMAIFSVLHLWAFPWAVYDVKKSAYVASESVPGYAPNKSSYQGGFLGTHALWDAFNLYDVIKAFGRAVRWLFVGRRKRHEDISYKANRYGTDFPAGSANGASAYGAGRFPGPDTDTSYDAGTQLQDTKPRPQHPPRYPSFEEGQQLLSYAQPNPTITVSGDGGDVGIMHPPASSTTSLRRYDDDSSPDRLPMNPTPYDGRHQQTGVVDTETRPYRGYYAQGAGGAPPRFPSPPQNGSGYDWSQSQRR
jgi:hypothetical protein